MSLAMYAAPFNDNSNNTDEVDNFINKKRQTHNKTQKRIPKENFNTEKVNSVLENIHNNLKPEDDDKSNLGDFNPPPMPQSAGVTRTTNTTEHMSNMSNNQVMFRTLGSAPQPNYETKDNLDMNNFTVNYGDNDTNEQYYKKILPGYKNNQNINPNNKPYYNVNNIPETQTQDVLLQKLNYMINLLEEQQDEKTSNVTEEVVLYSFLGIFIIFVVDSFVKAGKYIR